MSEYVAWQALDHLRRGREYRELQHRHEWRELAQAAAGEVTVGLMGLGLMGTPAAEVLLKLGFGVRGWSRGARDLPGVQSFAGDGQLDAFLSETDILVSLLPLTAETRHLVDLPLLRKLRRTGPLGGPVFISAGRGGSQVEADLLTALEDGVLVGASLDVFEDEPLPPDNPLWKLQNVFITPHVAAVSNAKVIAAEIAEQIEAFESGLPLRNCVEPERGY
jgi:glyoxylate/hydroxypyruvate reductase A